MTRRLVESLTGTGSIHAGDQLLRTTTYFVSVWWDDEPPKPGDIQDPSRPSTATSTSRASPKPWSWPVRVRWL